MDFSNPLSEEKLAEIQEIVSNTLKTFCTTYGLKFTAGLVDAAREAAPARRRSNYAPQGLQLIAAEVPSEPLHAGMFEKRGDFIKNWKTRWFVFNNKKDNFTVTYFTDEKMSKKKGDICLDGYTALLFDDDAKAAHGDHGVMLVCKGRRTWFIRGENAEVVATALVHFQNASKKARPAFKEGDKIEGAAFAAAYTATRQELEIEPVQKQPAGSEAEALGDMLTSLVMTKVVKDILDAIPEGMGGDAKRKLVNTGVGKVIAAAVKAVWETGKALLRQGRKALEAGIKSAIKPIMDAEKFVLDKISASCKSTIEPAIEKVMGGSGQKIVAAVCSPIKNLYLAAIKCWAEIAKVFTKTVSADGTSLDAAEMTANKAVWAGAEVFKSGSDALLGALSGLGDLLAEFDPTDFVSNVLDGVVNMMLKGVATMKVTITSGSTPDEAYALTLKRMVGDSKIMFADAVRGQVVSILEFPFNTLVRAPCLELAAPMDELIPEPVKAFMSISALMEKMFDATIESSAEALASPLTAPEEASIDALENELA